MKKIYLFTVSLVIAHALQATNYYVDAVNGNNSFSGLSTALAFRTVSAAANLTNPGDTVFILAGTYGAFTVSRSGTSVAGIVYTNYAGSLPKFESTINTYAVITVSPGSSYVTINGLEVVGYGVNLSLAADTIPAQAAVVCPVIGSPATSVTFIPKYNGSGIMVGNGSSSIGTHHITVSNNRVHDCAAAGITFGATDYITVQGNTVYNNSWYTPYGLSGISFGSSYNFDANTATYRNIIKQNTCYGNRLYVLWRASCTISDGNGIILDIPKTDYNGRTLVVNNLCYNNGGSGIHTLEMDHVDFFNNVAYLNSASPESPGSEIYAYNADDVRFYNNIMVSRPGKTVNRSPNATNIMYDYNIYYGGSTLDFVGANSLIQDPRFVNPSTDPAVADFHLQQGSFAVNNGNNATTTTFDHDGAARPVGGKVDMGMYESSYTGNLTTCSGTVQNRVLGTGSGTGETGAIFYGPYDTKPATANQKSRRAMIYPQTLLLASGVPSNATLYSLQFRRALQAGNTQVITNNSIIRIYLRNEAADNFGSAAFNWNTILPSASAPATLVYAGEAAPLVGSAGGWKTVAFQIPFDYTGGSLGVYIEYLQKGTVTAAPDINWIYDNGGSQPLYNITVNTGQQYATKATAASGNSVVSDNLSTSGERRPVLTLGYCTNAVLPVHLLHFAGTRQNSSVKLNWLITNETNNAGFEIQRSRDGNAFAAIAFVASKAMNGNGSATNQYEYIDVQPASEYRFYRLVQKDKDGRQTHSRIVTVSSIPGPVELISIFPNPVGNTLKALVSVSGSSKHAHISVQDLHGKVVRRLRQSLQVGYNKTEVDVSGQPSAAYILVIELNSGERIVQKFIKK